MNTIDVLLHVNETIEDAARIQLEEYLRDLEGVVAPHFSPGHNHLMFVDYDADSTTAAAILGQVRGRGVRCPDRRDLAAIMTANNARESAAARFRLGGARPVYWGYLEIALPGR